MIKLAILLGLLIAVCAGIAMTFMGAWALIEGRSDYQNAPAWVRIVGSLFAACIATTFGVRPQLKPEAEQ